MKIQQFLLFVVCLAIPVLSYAAKDETTWNQVLKQQFFSGKTILSGEGVIKLTTPKRAEDPALVPIKVTASLAQTKDKYIQRADTLERSRNGMKGVLVREQKKLARVRNGTCPCCQRHFKNLRRHMDNKHPQYKPGN